MSVLSVHTRPGGAYRLIVDALDRNGNKPKETTRGCTALCPAHDDHTPSLTVRQGDTGALVKCQAGCGTDVVVAGLDLTLADLFDAPRQCASPRAPEASKTRRTALARVATNVMQRRVAEYLYETANGDPLRRKVRLEPGWDGRAKTFVWERPTLDGWAHCEKGDGNPHILYALPIVSEADFVHLSEGEKAADALNAYFAEQGMSDHAATCTPTSAWEPLYTDALRGKSVELWTDRDESGERQAAEHYVALRKAGIFVRPVRSRTAEPKADAFDHLAAGYRPDQAEPFELRLCGEQLDEIEYRARFTPERTSIAYVFDTEPKLRDFLVRDFLPAHESGLIVAKGGTGKGHLQMRLSLSVALGEPFGPFSVSHARGVILLSVEDDREEFHRRFRAALKARSSDDENGRGWTDHVREILVKRVRFVDLRGITRPHLGHELRDAVARIADQFVDVEPGLILVDPLGRLTPPGTEINRQDGAAVVVNELDALRQVTGASAIAVYHVTKQAVRDGGELRGGASSGSLQLEDLSRWVLNLKALTNKESGDHGLDTAQHYVEAVVTKTNYTPPLSEPLVFRRVAGGSLVHAPAKSRNEFDDVGVLSGLIKAGEWLTRDEWQEAAVEQSGLSKHRVESARSRLEHDGKIERRELRDRRKTKHVFAPAEYLRHSSWPSPPATLADLEERK